MKNDDPEKSPAGFARRVLVLFAHPALEKSRVNRRLVEAVRDLPGVTFHDLYQAYPDFHVFVEREQELLVAHDVLVLQHPFFWYSTPALVKEWEDQVLQHGWAYGSKGKALVGKTMVSAITTGGAEVSYQVDGFTGHTIRQLLAPVSQSFRLCGMECLPPFAVHGTLSITSDEIDRQAMDYRRVIEALRDDRIDAAKVADLPRLNLDLDALLGTSKPSSEAT
jgi:glutathione-regulated potassium-efflux system ancillary protein KefG